MTVKSNAYNGSLLCRIASLACTFNTVYRELHTRGVCITLAFLTRLKSSTTPAFSILPYEVHSADKIAMNINVKIRYLHCFCLSVRTTQTSQCINEDGAGWWSGARALDPVEIDFLESEDQLEKKLFQNFKVVFVE